MSVSAAKLLINTDSSSGWTKPFCMFCAEKGWTFLLLLATYSDNALEYSMCP